MPADRVRTELKVKNGNPTAWSFWVEPWAEAYAVPPGETYTIVIESEGPPNIEWSFEPDGPRLSVGAYFGPDGVVAETVGVYANGERVPGR
jgi:hypothetical protein